MSKEIFSKWTESINHIFGILELLVIRLTLLGLAILGAYALLHSHMLQ